MTYKDTEWMLQEHKTWEWNGNVATISPTHCPTCNDFKMHYHVQNGRTLYTECLTCHSWYLNRNKYNRSTSFMQNTIKRALGVS